MSQPLLIGIGEILWDMLPGGKQLGGAPANFAYHANVLGGRGVAVSRVGDDPLGHEILDRIDSLRLPRPSIQIDPTHPTGMVDVRLDAAGVPQYVIHPDVAWDYLEIETPQLELACQADCVCFGTLAQRCEQSRAAIQGFLAATRPDCLRIFDINFRQDYFSRQLVHDLLSTSGVLKLNDQELPILAGLLDLDPAGENAIKALLDRYPLSLVALTCGSHGGRLYDAGGAVSNHPGVHAQVVDTVGAGDAFTAALALGLLSDMSLDEINRRANEIAAYVCTQGGATPPMPPELSLAPNAD